LSIFRFLTPISAILSILAATWDCFRGRASHQIEVIALRHQLHVLERSVKRPKLTASDRFFWACLAARMVKILERAETVMSPRAERLWEKRYASKYGTA